MGEPKPSVQAGLCERCLHRRLVDTGRSTFVLCERALDDATYPKYPVLPVRRCRGHDPVPATPPRPAG